MWLKTSCDLKFDIAVPTPFILMLRPLSGAEQWVAGEEYRISPNVSVYEFTDNYGNLCQRLTALPGIFTIRTSADVRIAEYFDQATGAAFIEIQNLLDSVLSYLCRSLSIPARMVVGYLYDLRHL